MTINVLEDPKNPYEAFKKALVLHITAPTIEDSNEALYLAETFSENLTEEEILKAKNEVDIYLDELDKKDPSLKKSIKIDNYLTPGWNEELDNLEIFNLDED